VHDHDANAQRFAALAALGLERVDVVPIETDAFPVGRDAWKVVQTRPAMGTRVSITAVVASQQRAVDACGHAFDEMDRVISLLNRYDPRSALSDLNAAGRLDHPPPELHHVLDAAADAHRKSGGAFDVTVAPLLALFRERLSGPAALEPTAAEIRDTLDRVGARHLAVSKRQVTFAREGMAVTLDGIAKGYIVDAMAGVLDRQGVGQYLIDAGGDIRTRGMREGGHPWTVAVRDPAGQGVYPEVLHLEGGAVATSGSYEVHFDDDLAFHHIVDAATGRSPAASLSVSVRAATAMAADALATAVFVLGPEAGVRLVDGLRGCGCLVVGRDGRQWKSRRWRSIPLSDGDEAGT
jgi:thiamine biosynthesis lipoprotein